MSVESDSTNAVRSKPDAGESSGPSRSAALSFPLFDEGLSIAEVAKKIGRAESTTRGYLNDYIRFQKVTDASRWVDAETIAKVTAAVYSNWHRPVETHLRRTR